jgi:predicted N-formylglutamate amidohydrolase
LSDAFCSDRYIIHDISTKINEFILTASGPHTLNASVTSADDHTILNDTDGPVAEVINPDGAAPICLVCEHASAFIPASLMDLGVAPEHRHSHAAWDIGGRDLAVALSHKLDAPLVAARVSRLVYDCNRPPDARDAIPTRSEMIDVPGNAGLAERDRSARVTEVYEPFRALLMGTLDAFPAPPVMMTIHTFTPTWFGVPRQVELGLLHDSDDTLAKAMLDAAPADVDTRLNAPYDATDGVTHTLREHAISRSLPNVMIEVRNDLVSDKIGVARFADILGDMLTAAMLRTVAP